MLGVFQRQAGAAGYCLEGVFRHPELDVDFVGEALGYAPQQRSAAGKPDAVLDYVRIQFRRSSLQDLDDFAFDFGNSLVYAEGDVPIRNGRTRRMGRDEVLTLYDEVFRLLFGRQLGQYRSDGKLYLLRRGAPDADVVLPSKVVDDVGRYLVACNVDAGRFHDAAQGYPQSPWCRRRYLLSCCRWGR